MKKILSALVSWVGMLFVSGVFGNGGISGEDAVEIIYGLSAALLYASVIILNKKTGSVDAYSKTAIELFAASVTILPYLLLTEDLSSVTLSVSDVLLVFIGGVLHTGIAYTMYFASINSLPAGSVAMLSYIDPVSALVLFALILNEKMSSMGWLGAGMVIISAYVSEWRGKKK